MQLKSKDSVMIGLGSLLMTGNTLVVGQCVSEKKASAPCRNKSAMSHLHCHDSPIIIHRPEYIECMTIIQGGRKGGIKGCCSTPSFGVCPNGKPLAAPLLLGS